MAVFVDIPKMMLWCLVAALINGTSTNANQNFTKKCDNGQELLAEEFCDGMIHCKDGSDETVVACLHIRCPDFAFQCAYGACVNGRGQCDGHIDCMDKSDENKLKCEGVIENYGIGGNCSEVEFKCNSGECIPGFVACDGKKDCLDGSDETVDLCSAIYCPAFAFKCGYGACIRGGSKCDGAIDCLDKSDESEELCGKAHSTTESYEDVSQEVTVPPTASSTESVVSTSNEGCLVSNIPNMKSFTISYDKPLVPGQLVSHMTGIRYQCGPRHVLDGTSINTCMGGLWTQPLPTCLRYCSYVPLFGVTFSSKCEFNGTEIPCNQKLRPGTKAALSCKSGYRKPNRIVHDVITCDEHGEWDYSPFRCQAICGVTKEEGTDIAFPWHAAIYNKQHEQICGGTIINAKVVLSAAHCFWDQPSNVIRDVADFVVAVGKRFRNFYAADKYSQFFNISELFLPPGFQGSKLFYQFDVAIVILNNYITYSNEVVPICIRWRSFKSGQKRRNHNDGEISGWGNSVDDEIPLKTFSLSKIDFRSCLRKTPLEYRKLITNDKFCVDGGSERPICEWDCGAGFVTSRVRDGVKMYSLKGVISHPLTNASQCVGSYCSACTDIQVHADLIAEYEAKYRPK